MEDILFITLQVFSVLVNRAQEPEKDKVKINYSAHVQCNEGRNAACRVVQ